MNKMTDREFWIEQFWAVADNALVKAIVLAFSTTIITLMVLFILWVLDISFVVLTVGNK